jgi:penicillin-binding protein 2
MNKLYLVLSSLLVVAVLLGIARLIDLQIIQGEYFRELAEGNRIRRIPIRAPRGQILDRNGKALARNVPVYKLAKFSKSGLVESTETLTREEAFRIQAEGGEEASRLFIDIRREYPEKEATAHLIGYVGEVGKDEVGKSPDSCKDSPVYTLGDFVGRAGIEAEYDCLLRGKNGEELIEVDIRGRFVRRLGRREPIPGKDIKLSIDADLQQKAYEALINAPNIKGSNAREDGITVQGAFVAQDPKTGEVLALLSVPSYNPNNIAKDYPRLSNDPNLPLFNRAIGGGYHPGSTFKIITSVAGLEERKIDRNWQFVDVGFIKVGDFVYKNWYFTQYGKTEGVINIVQAIARSTDTFFYKVGELLGPTSLASWAKKFGLGKKTGVDLPAEAEGIVPDPEWKRRVKGERWFLGNTYHLAIGQGDITATPLQINQVTSVIASGGKLCTPHIATSILSKSVTCKDLEIRKETIDIVKEGMVGACSPGGTAFPFFNFEPQIACKTGTAQTNSDKTHAWFTAFAPFDEPQIVATVLIEHGGEGSRVAAPVLREVLSWWFTIAKNKK